MGLVGNELSDKAAKEALQLDVKYQHLMLKQF